MREPMIHCVIVRMTMTEETMPKDSNPQPVGLDSAQDDLLPWADPYIFQLIEKLQREVRAERKSARRHGDLGHRNPRLRDHQPRWTDADQEQPTERHYPRQPR